LTAFFADAVFLVFVDFVAAAARVTAPARPVAREDPVRAADAFRRAGEAEAACDDDFFVRFFFDMQNPGPACDSAV
jgi:hypothetical protein